MLTVLLVIIYISFISLGLPDALMGSAWPVMHQELGVSIDAAGIATLITSGGTIISSFFSGKLLQRFGTGKVTVGSVCLTAVGLIGCYLAPSFWWICLLCVLLGIGAGAVDAALNNFVALRYEAKHMNWLHCFWGIGATSGPLIMAFHLTRSGDWRMGYATIGTLQAILVICLFASLPLWKKVEQQNTETSEEVEVEIGVRQLLQLKGAKPALVSYLCYCAVELTVGLWVSSYAVMTRGVTAETAAQWVSIYYLGITVGRLIAGFISMKITNKNLIRLGEGIALGGIILVALPIDTTLLPIAIGLIGMGFAPIYPAMLHETPERFGKEVSGSIMGIQMATAYVGSTFVPPLFGILANQFGFGLLPYFIGGVTLIMIVMVERVNKVCYKK